MPKDSWPEPVVSPEEWRRLIAAAEAFKAAASWEWMLEEMLFAVQNPETGELGFCSVTGQLGEHRALIVYLGEQGLGRYLIALRGMKYASSFIQEKEHGMMLLETPQLQASFESRQQIADLDRQIIKDLKVRIRGRDAWPIFRSFVPGRMPWYINGPQARFLTVLLEQALIVTQAHRDGQYAINAPNDATLPAALPLQLRVREGEAWIDQQITVTPQYPSVPNESPLSQDDLAAWRRKLPLRDVEVQIHLQMLPTPVQEGALPPYFPYLLLVVEAQQGLIMGIDTLLPHPTLEDLWSRILPGLLSVFEKAQVRPKKIQVASERLYNVLAMPLGQLGIKLTRVQQMAALEDALMAFENWSQQF